MNYFLGGQMKNNGAVTADDWKVIIFFTRYGPTYGYKVDTLALIERAEYPTIFHFKWPRYSLDRFK